MLRRNRPDAALAVLLLSIFAPWSIAAELAPSAGRSRVRLASAEEISPAISDRQAAEKRWNDLKSRHQGGSAPLWRPPTKTESRSASSSVRAFPPDEPGSQPNELSAEETTDAVTPVEEEIRATTAGPRDVDAPLPISDFEESPGWITGNAPDVAERDPDEDDSFFPKDSDADANVDPAPEESPEVPIPDEPKSLESQEPADPGYASPPGERRLRRMTEISPHYDVTIDEDIRTFAKEQAKQYNVEFQKGVFPARNFPGFVYQWEPSNMYHFPLYFEDVPLERYGHTYHPVIQPVVSIAKFSTQLAFLPYQMTLDPICTPKYVLGYYRPGECAPKLHYRPPLNAQAAAVEAGVVTGLFFAIP